MSLSNLLRAETKLKLPPNGNFSLICVAHLSLREHSPGRIAETRLWFSSTSPSSSSSDHKCSASSNTAADCRADSTDAISEKSMTAHSIAPVLEKENQKQGGTWLSIQKFVSAYAKKGLGRFTDIFFSPMKDAVLSVPEAALELKSKAKEDIEAGEGSKLFAKTIKQLQPGSHFVCSNPSTNKICDKMAEMDHKSSLKYTESSLEFVNENLYPDGSIYICEDGSVGHLDLAETKPCEKKHVSGMTTILQRRKDSSKPDKICSKNGVDLPAPHVSSDVEVMGKTVLEHSYPLVCNVVDNMSETDHKLRLENAESSVKVVRENQYPGSSKTITKDESGSDFNQLDLGKGNQCVEKQMLRRKENFTSDKVSSESGTDSSVKNVFSGNKDSSRVVDMATILQGRKDSFKPDKICTKNSADLSAPHISSVIGLIKKTVEQPCPLACNEVTAVLDNMPETDLEPKLEYTESSLEVVSDKPYPVSSKTISQDECVAKADQLDLGKGKQHAEKQVLGMVTILQRRKDNFASDKVNSASGNDLSANHAFSGIKDSSRVVSMSTILQKRKDSSKHVTICTKNNADFLVPHVSSVIESIEKTTKQPYPVVCNEVVAISDNMSETDHELKPKYAESSLEVLTEKPYPVSSKTVAEDESAAKVHQLDFAEGTQHEGKQVLGMVAILQRRDNFASDKVSSVSGNDLLATHVFPGNKDSFGAVGSSKACRQVNDAEIGYSSTNGSSNLKAS